MAGLFASLGRRRPLVVGFEFVLESVTCIGFFFRVCCSVLRS